MIIDAFILTLHYVISYCMLLLRYTLPLYQVDPHSGGLTPVDVVPHKPCTAPSAAHLHPHSPPVKLLQAKAKEQHHEQVNAFFDTKGKIFQGGNNAAMLHQVLHIASGDQLLYVGSAHILFLPIINYALEQKVYGRIY